MILSLKDLFSRYKPPVSEDKYEVILFDMTSKFNCWSYNVRQNILAKLIFSCFHKTTQPWTNMAKYDWIWQIEKLMGDTLFFIWIFMSNKAYSLKKILICRHMTLGSGGGSVCQILFYWLMKFLSQTDLYFLFKIFIFFSSQIFFWNKKKIFGSITIKQ